MSAPAISVLALAALFSIVGVTLLTVTSVRLRGEIQGLFRAFDRAERQLVPLVATVATDRERLANRLARLSAPDTEADPPRR